MTRVAVSGADSCQLAGQLADAMIAVTPDPQLGEQFDAAGGEGKRRIGQVPISWDPSRDAAIDRAVRHSVPKPTALIVNFPSNPTAHLASLDFYKELVALARRHEFYILSDLAYAELYFDGEPPPSKPKSRHSKKRESSASTVSSAIP